MLRRITLSRVECSPVVLKRLFNLLVAMTLIVSAPVVFTGCDSGTAIVTDNESNDGDEGENDGDGNTSPWNALGEGVCCLALSEVYALALSDEGNVYVGGGFPNAGGVRVNRIALWDGSRWSALAAGLSGRVNAIVVDNEGALYAGGGFFNSGTTTLRRIGRWNGETWSSLGGGFAQGLSVNDMTLSAEGDLYVAGNLIFGINPDGTYVGDLGGVGVFKWDSSEWSTLTDPDVTQGVAGIGGEVNTILIDDLGGVYAGGRFVLASGKTVNNVAYWNGETWSDLGGGVGGTVLSLALDNEGLVVSGSFNSAGNIVADNMARWNGSEWTPFANENPGARALAYGPDGRLYAGGYFSGELVSRWTGTEWEGIGSGPLSGSVTTMQFDPSGYLYVGGNFSAIDGVEANGVARWDGLVE